jgi:hypothetical protein
MYIILYTLQYNSLPQNELHKIFKTRCYEKQIENHASKEKPQNFIAKKKKENKERRVVEDTC